MVRPAGGAMTLSENSAFVMSQEGEPELAGQPVLAGAPEGGAGAEEPEVRLCELVDSTPAKFILCTIDDPGAEECDWKLLKVPESEVPNYLGISAVYAGTDKNDLGLDEDCKERPLGLGWKAKTGIVVGSVVGGLVLYEEVIEEEEEEPASPSRP